MGTAGPCAATERERSHGKPVIRGNGLIGGNGLMSEGSSKWKMKKLLLKDGNLNSIINEKVRL